MVVAAVMYANIVRKRSGTHKQPEETRLRNLVDALREEETFVWQRRREPLGHPNCAKEVRTTGASIPCFLKKSSRRQNRIGNQLNLQVL